MHQITVDLSITADEWLKVYRGSARVVRARARDGRHVRFPANLLARFLQRDGIRGSYLITFDEQNRFVEIQELSTDR